MGKAKESEDQRTILLYGGITGAMLGVIGVLIGFGFIGMWPFLVVFYAAVILVGSIISWGLFIMHRKTKDQKERAMKYAITWCAVFILAVGLSFATVLSGILPQRLYWINFLLFLTVISLIVWFMQPHKA